VSLEVAPERLTAVMGPSGSGKSTLMHVLAALDRPDSGEAWIGEREITALDDAELTELRRNSIGFVFQFFNLLPMLTGEENILLPLEIAGRRPDQGWYEELIGRVGLGDRLGHRPSEMSGGQQQRVAVARALVTSPALILADEPTGNLDSTSSADVMALFDRLHQAGRTIVLITHEHDIAEHASRAIRLMDGQIVSDERNGARGWLSAQHSARHGSA
jgi:putative ABC transport system ATP-binding protein